MNITVAPITKETTCPTAEDWVGEITTAWAQLSKITCRNSYKGMIQYFIWSSYIKPLTMTSCSKNIRATCFGYSAISITGAFPLSWSPHSTCSGASLTAFIESCSYTASSSCCKIKLELAMDVPAPSKFCHLQLLPTSHHGVEDMH